MSKDLVEVQVWAQDPLSMPERVTIAIPNMHLDSGPRDAQFVVHDVDHGAGAVYQPARFLPDQNAFEQLDPDDVRTHQINAFAIARRTLEMIESAVGRQGALGVWPAVGDPSPLPARPQRVLLPRRGRAGLLLL